MRLPWLALACLALSAGSMSCKSRFPVCETNDDCKSKAEGDPAAKNLLCYDLRCVECRYDSDCPEGHTCERTNQCKSLGGPRPDYSQPTATATAEAAPSASAAR